MANGRKINSSPARKERIAIAGAGIAGAYLYRLLRKQGHAVEIFDRHPGTKCGLRPCAWGTTREFVELVKDAGLNPETYVLRTFDYLLMEDRKVRADVMTLHKPKLIQDLLQGALIHYSPFQPADYDRIIDATGVARALLPALPGDIIMPCIQYRIRTDASLNNRVKLGGVGYAWCFPLEDHEYHLGCGSLRAEPRKIMEELGWIPDIPEDDGGKMICACASTIRLTGPQLSQPFVSNGVWGIGEAIGCVAPLAGDGIIPGMRSVRILLDCWGNAEDYTAAILDEFRWMEKERVVVDKLMREKPLGIRDAWALKKNARRMGIELRLKEAGLFLKNLM